MFGKKGGLLEATKVDKSNHGITMFLINKMSTYGWKFGKGSGNGYVDRICSC